MIIRITICIDTLHKLGKEFKWKKPECCPRCRGKLHGHGFCLSYFSEYKTGLYIKRYRCTNCSCVIRLRPIEYVPRLRSSINTIY